MTQQEFETFLKERIKEKKQELHTFKNWAIGLLFIFGIVAIIHWIIEIL